MLPILKSYISSLVWSLFSGVTVKIFRHNSYDSVLMSIQSNFWEYVSRSVPLRTSGDDVPSTINYDITYILPGGGRRNLQSNGDTVVSGTLENGQADLSLLRGQCYNLQWSATSSSATWTMTLSDDIAGSNVISGQQTITVQSGETSGTHEFCVMYQVEYEGNQSKFTYGDFFEYSKKWQVF